ncbi:hypothetical protein AgCh_014548 [Apium graveolens]
MDFMMQTTTNSHEDEEACLLAMQLATASVLPMVLKAAIELDLLEIIAKAGPRRLYGVSMAPLTLLIMDKIMMESCQVEDDDDIQDYIDVLEHLQSQSCTCYDMDKNNQEAHHHRDVVVVANMDKNSQEAPNHHREVVVVANMDKNSQEAPNKHREMVAVAGAKFYRYLYIRNKEHRLLASVAPKGAQHEVHASSFEAIQYILDVDQNRNLCTDRNNPQLYLRIHHSDWAGDHDDSKSTSGNVFFVGSGAISWMSKKQVVVALSTSEAEYISLVLAGCHAIWIKWVLQELKQSFKDCPEIYCDNSSAIAISKDPVFHGKIKHIRIKYHFIRDLIKNGEIEVKYCRSEEQTSDIFSKPLKLEAFTGLKTKLGVTRI